MVERPTGRTRRTLQGEWSSDQQVPPDAEIREPRRRVLARGIGDQDESIPVFPDEPCRGNGRAPNRSHPTNPAGGMVERPTGPARRGDPRAQTTGFGSWNRRPGRIDTGIPRRTLQGEWSSAQQVAPDEPCRGNGRATNRSRQTRRSASPNDGFWP